MSKVINCMQNIFLHKQEARPWLSFKIPSNHPIYKLTTLVFKTLSGLNECFMIRLKGLTILVAVTPGSHRD